MPTPEEIRERFKKHLGVERYREFVYRVPDSIDGTRLLFWQEREWKRFEDSNQDCKLDFNGIVNVFASCPEFGIGVRRHSWNELVATWLRGESLTVDEIENREPARSTDGYPQLQSFGVGSKLWEQWKQNMQPSDRIVEFQSPPDSWAQLAGRAGFALVRDGKVVDTLVTRMN